MGLETIWFFLWGLLWAIYFVTDGFDLGVGTLIPFLGKNDNEKRIMYNSIGPVWDGNEVWLITAGGVTFAAFPLVYAVMFSSLYSALMLILFALIFRGVCLEFRHQVDSPGWKLVWDTCMCISSFLPAFLFGVAFANIFKGIPIDGEGIYHGTLGTLLNSYGVMGGLLFALFFLLHGSIWTAIKTEGALHERSEKLANTLWFMVLVVSVFFIAASKYATKLFENYMSYPVLYIFVFLTICTLIAIKLYLNKKQYWKAWFASAATIAGCTFFGIIGLYPTLFPSSLSSAFSLTIKNSASSPLTLKIMLVVAIIFVPVVLAYQIWSYTLFNEKIVEEEMVY